MVRSLETAAKSCLINYFPLSHIHGLSSYLSVYGWTVLWLRKIHNQEINNNYGVYLSLN